MEESDAPAGVSEELAEARPTRPADLALVRARVQSALFGGPAGLGRFHVLERLGRGGMGVVYAAYDPELDRRVALKTIHVSERGRELAVVEAKALARLSHPNVVPVFDVGVIGEHVYIVMELVRGATLREYVKDKPARAIVEIYMQAGAALAAAHAAGLVHRDFKPDNAIVGTDGRVRVVDFGLACEATEVAGDGAAAAGARRGAAGTPRYMAPEQAEGRITPAVDQFSFCVSLDEALRGSGDPPARWLAEIVERGRAPAPELRFASMHELLRALGRDPSRVWRRRAGAAALVAVLGGTFLVGQALAVDATEPCIGGDDEIAAAWPPEARASQLVRIASLSAYGGQLAPRLADQIGAHTARWAAQHRDACLAHRRGVVSGALLDRRMACLSRARAALNELAEIAGAADGRALPDVARAAIALPDPAACADEALAEVELPPAAIAPRVAQLRDELVRARIQLAAGRAIPARDAARAAAAELRRLSYRPLLAEALLIEGRASMRTDPPAAIEALEAATTTAFLSHSDAIAIEAWARRAWLEGVRQENDAAFAGLQVIEALAVRTPAPFARALLAGNLGSFELRRGHRAEARAAFERSQRESRGATGAGAVELVSIRANLALVTDDPDRRDQVFADAHGELVRLLGDSHPDTLVLQYRRAATSSRRLEDASALLAATCERLAAHDSVAPFASPCLAELADIRDELGDRPGALAASERALRAPDPEHPERAGYLALWRGDAAAAIRAFEAAIAARPHEADPYEQFVRAKLLLGHARALRAAGRLAASRTVLERRFASVDPSKEPSTTAVERRLARARAELAAVLAETGGPPAQTGELARQALAWYRSAGAPPSTIAALEALLRGSR